MKTRTWMLVGLMFWLGLGVPQAHACLNSIGKLPDKNNNHFSLSGQGRSIGCYSEKNSITETYDVRADMPDLYETRSAQELSSFWQTQRAQVGCISTESISIFVRYYAKLPTSQTIGGAQHVTIHRSSPYAEEERLARPDTTEYNEEWKLRMQDNNGAVEAIKNGRLGEAVALLLKIEKRDPGHYETATNLGTAYELLGNNTEALKWIEEGIKRNPYSHEGSEWLHVLILKAKIQSKGDPRWFENNSIMGLPFLTEGLDSKKVVLPTNNLNKKAALNEVMFHIMKQLEERMPLVKPKDPVVSNILYDLAHLAAIHSSLHDGSEILEAAQSYGHSQAGKARVGFDWRETAHWTQSFNKNHLRGFVFACLLLPLFLYTFTIVAVIRQKVSQMVPIKIIRSIFFTLYAIAMIPAALIGQFILFIPLTFLSSITHETANIFIALIATLVSLLIPTIGLILSKPLLKHYRIQIKNKKKDLTYYTIFLTSTFACFIMHIFLIKWAAIEGVLMTMTVIGGFISLLILWALMSTFQLDHKDQEASEEPKEQP